MGYRAALAVGSVGSVVYAYRLLDFHHVEPMSTSATAIKHVVPIPTMFRGGHSTLNYAMYDEVLSEFVVDGKVKYIDLRKSMMREKRSTSLFIRWLHVLTKCGPNTTPLLFRSEDEKLKYYINAYNALTVWAVIHHSFYYKNNHSLIGSVMNVRSRLEPKQGFGFFKAATYFLDNDRNVSLHFLENEILRKQFSDARVHCAINCASNGCPKLQSKVIEIEDLDELCVSFVNDPLNVNINQDEMKIQASHIFNWYSSDFEQFYEKRQNGSKLDDDETAENLANRGKWLFFIYFYGKKELRRDLQVALQNNFQIEWMPYDWKLNAAVR